MNKSYSYDSFLYGVVYYPEQWPEAQWDSDLARIAQTGMNVVRMGEGAWSVWEPEEGRYDFALFDRALELCQRHELKAIMGTPTYTPPAWLTERYPEVSRVSFARSTPDARFPAPLQLYLTDLSAEVSRHHRGAGRTLPKSSGGDRLAD